MAGPALKQLGKTGSPTAATSVLHYTVPASTSAVASKMVITNTSPTATTVFVSVVCSGATCAAKDSVVAGVTVPGCDYIEALQGVTLAAGDFVCVQNTLATVNFTLFGQENS